MSETPHAAALRDELETIEGIPTYDRFGRAEGTPTVTVEDKFGRVEEHPVPVGVKTPVSAEAGDFEVIAETTLAIDGRSWTEEDGSVTDTGPRHVSVALIANPDGTTSRLSLTGAGIGRHVGSIRVWPNSQQHKIEFDGDGYSRDLGFVATGCIVEIDGSDEIRAGNAGEHRE